MTDDQRESTDPATVDALDSSELPADVPDEFAAVPTGTEGAVATIRERARDGSLAAVGAVGTLLGAVRATGRSRAVLGVFGAALAGLAITQRRSDEPSLLESDEPDDDGAGPETVDVEFTDDRREPRTKPNADGDVDDPRRNDDGEDVTVDVSDVATADEVGEAVGPDPEQAQPTHAQGTEPDGTPDEDIDASPADATRSVSGDGEAFEKGFESEFEADDEDGTGAADEVETGAVDEGRTDGDDGAGASTAVDGDEAEADAADESEEDGTGTADDSDDDDER
ncbi:hypothetical protein [Halovivax sp.]|uniref:hypothetical protein n=1 Tax=Halovivax sp. TaxID=1935978 RepID=UPI0025BF5B36|nr:hypothetical protein [Halovivax sp.]